MIQELKISQTPYLVKIDVEGAENMVLEGAQKFIAQYKPIFLIELHSPQNFIKTYHFFSKLHYKITQLFSNNEHRTFIYVEPIPEIKSNQFIKLITESQCIGTEEE